MQHKKDTLYTIATAHLDTSWLWKYEQSVSEYIPETFLRNFALIKKYPGYKFNFEGSLRYELLKEYYPSIFEQLKDYVKDGTWNPCGACFENGDVNIPSPEALIRNILYGNGFFKKELGVKSNDIFLPDCFGFGRALPSVAAHCGLKGFSTGKLVWGCGNSIPFHIGKWNGIDGNGVWSAVTPGSYTTILKDIRNHEDIKKKMAEDKEKYGLHLGYAYHGNGDRGGAPYEGSVQEVVNCMQTNDENDLQVLSATTKEFFEAIDSLSEEEKAALPVWDSEFLMTRHGAGSYTSRTVTKRWNRRSELLADAAERFASAAFVYGMAEYPGKGLDAAWKKVLAHHFHDDITGTSFEECYERSFDDYVQAMHTFSAEYTAACKTLAHNADTSFVQGTAVVVSNPVQARQDRTQAVTAVIASADPCFRVFDKDGKEVPSQVRTLAADKKEIVFTATVPSCGFAVFDVRPADSNCNLETALRVENNCLENDNILVKIDNNGDICSVFDKNLQKELLLSPIRAGIYNNVNSFEWPAWEIKFEDIDNTRPYLNLSAPDVKIKDNGPALCSLEIKRTAGDSTFTQVISLDANSRFVSVYNETDWREEASLLKMEFAFAAENEKADYDIGLGYTQRGNNTKELYEVPAQKWAGITDKNALFGVAVLSDSRQGWDKPNNNTLRLTCIHTPLASYRQECSQHLMDMGLNRYSFAVCGYSGTPDLVTAQSDLFCQPMHTFVTEKHTGAFGAAYSFVRVDTDEVRISAIKKAQQQDAIIVRFTETAGKPHDCVQTVFSLPVASAYAVTGDEEILHEVALADGQLSFDMRANEIRSFALTFQTPATAARSTQEMLPLTYNACGITTNKNRTASTVWGGVSLPMELLPDILHFAGVAYRFSGDEQNCVVCNGQEITVPDGTKTLHLLVASLSGDKDVPFVCGEKTVSVRVPACDEAVGMWDLMMRRKTGYIKPQPQALSLSHTHMKNGDAIGKQFFLFTADLPVDGKTYITLPQDKELLLFAATAESDSYAFSKADEHFDTLEKRAFDYTFSRYARNHAAPKWYERKLDKHIDRTITKDIKMGGFYNKNSVAEIYFAINRAIDMLFYKRWSRQVTEERNGTAKKP